MHPGIFHAGSETILEAKFVVVCLIMMDSLQIITIQVQVQSPKPKVQSQKDLE